MQSQIPETRYFETVKYYVTMNFTTVSSIYCIHYTQGREPSTRRRTAMIMMIEMFITIVATGRIAITLVVIMFIENRIAVLLVINYYHMIHIVVIILTFTDVAIIQVSFRLLSR